MAHGTPVPAFNQKRSPPSCLPCLPFLPPLIPVSRGRDVTRLPFCLRKLPGSGRGPTRCSGVTFPRHPRTLHPPDAPSASSPPALAESATQPAVPTGTSEGVPVLDWQTPPATGSPTTFRPYRHNGVIGSFMRPNDLSFLSETLLCTVFSYGPAIELFYRR